MKAQKKDEHSLFPHFTRRDFLKTCGMGLSVFLFSLLGFPRLSTSQIVKKGLIKTKLSPWFTKLDRKVVQCELCPRRCRVSNGNRGFCRVRENKDGEYYSLVYGNPCALNLDPIEKKPFYHVLPGTASLSIATAGCNFECKFCQNWEISQATPEDIYSYDVSPEMIISKARQMGARSVAYTYTEPTVFYEYTFDTCIFVRKAGLLNVMHSNGFINTAPLEKLCNFLDAANIDLKDFTETFYQELCSGYLSPVLETLKTLKKNNVHIEITTLIIPTKNDNMSVIKDMCLWIKKELSSETPIHFSRFYPLYKLKSLPPTPVSTLENARSVAIESGLKYVYIGNVQGHEAQNTFCARCGKMLIQRTGFMVGEVNIINGKCKYCGNKIPGIWA